MICAARPHRVRFLDHCNPPRRVLFIHFRLVRRLEEPSGQVTSAMENTLGEERLVVEPVENQVPVIRLLHAPRMNPHELRPVPEPWTTNSGALANWCKVA